MISKARELTDSLNGKCKRCYLAYDIFHNEFVRKKKLKDKICVKEIVYKLEFGPNDSAKDQKMKKPNQRIQMKQKMVVQCIVT